MTHPPNHDAAAMHPALSAQYGTAKNYYQSCARQRFYLQERLQQQLGCPHELHIVPNTSVGLLVCLLGLILDRRNPGPCVGQSYPKYAALFEGIERAFATSAAPQPCPIVTHICPLTGAVQNLRPYQDFLFLVDAAQSLGTSFQEPLFEFAPLFVAPLHKHLGLRTGLGLIGIHVQVLPEAARAMILACIHIATHGTQDLMVLEALIEALNKRPPSLNRARIQVGEALRQVADQHGLEVLTPPGIQAHIVSLRPLYDCPITSLLDPDKANGKLFSQQNTLRLSFHSDIHGRLTPKDYEDLTIRVLKAAGERHGT